MRTTILSLLLAHVLSNERTGAASIGAYINAGLGLPTTTQTSSSPLAPASTANYNASSVSTRYTNTSTSSTATSALDLGSALACIDSWSSYEAFSSTAESLVDVTYTTYIVMTANITYGTGDVYTTSAGIPVAKGNFTPTAVETTALNITTTSLTFTLTTQDPARLNSTPTCSTIPPSQCSNLYVTYLSSLGLSANASVPVITPAPSNSPPCPTYYYQPWSTCSVVPDEDISSFGRCTVSGANVQVIYFPPSTQNVSAPNVTVVQSYAPGITFTSPSIYLSFDYLSARSTAIDTLSLCTFCDNYGCATVHQGGYQLGVGNQGTSIAGQLLSLAPEDVSTLLYDYPGAQATSMVNLLAHAPIGESNPFIDKIIDAGSAYNLAPALLNLNSMTHPAPTDYYLNPGDVPGCDSDAIQPECHTIFEGLYHPIISLPSYVSLLQGAWNTCVPIIFGAYDPPIALTQATTIAGVSYHPQTTTTDGPQSTSTNVGASPPNGLSAVVPGPTSTYVQPESTTTNSPAGGVSPSDNTFPAGYASASDGPSPTDVASPPGQAPPVVSVGSPALPQPESIQAQSGSAQAQQPTDTPNGSGSRASDPAIAVQPPTTTNALSILEGALTSSKEAQSQGVADPGVASGASVKPNGQPTSSEHFTAPTAGNSGAAGSEVAINVGSQTVTVAQATGGAIVVAGQTISQGGSATIGGQTYSARPSGLVVNGVSTVAVPDPSADPGISPFSSAEGAIAATTTFIDGQALTISMGSQGAAIVNGLAASETRLVTAGGGQTVTVVQVGGSTLSLPPSEVGGVTQAAGAVGPLTTSINGQPYTISQGSQGAAVINGITASETSLMMESGGQTVTVVQSGGSSFTLPAATSSLVGGEDLVAPVETVIGGQTYTISQASDGGIFVDGTIATRTALLTEANSQTEIAVDLGSTTVLLPVSAASSRASSDSAGASSANGAQSAPSSSTSTSGVAQTRAERWPSLSICLLILLVLRIG